MLPTIYRLSYEKLEESLTRFSLSLAADDFTSLKTLMETEIMLLSDDNLPPEIKNKWRGIQTELYRSWRLLETDLLFLQTSSKSREKKLKTIGDRIGVLKEYCRILLER